LSLRREAQVETHKTLARSGITESLGQLVSLRANSVAHRRLLTARYFGSWEIFLRDGRMLPVSHGIATAH